MVTKVLSGGITRGIRRIKKADYKPSVQLDVSSATKASLVVVEYGDCRLLPISRKVAEVLIANGMSYGT